MRYRQKNDHSRKAEAFQMPCSGEIKFASYLDAVRFHTGSYIAWTHDMNPPMPFVSPSDVFERDYEPDPHVHNIQFGASIPSEFRDFGPTLSQPRETHIHIPNDPESDVTITIRRRESRPANEISSDDARLFAKRMGVEYKGEPS